MPLIIASKCLSFVSLIAMAAVSAATPFKDRPSSQITKKGGPANPGFEMGTLEGWEIVSGDAFGNDSVTNSKSYWDGLFQQDQEYFILGTAQSGESAVGELKSTSFKAKSVMSFLVGGGYDPQRLYVGLVRDEDGQLLLKQTGVNDEAMLRVVWDTSEWTDQMVHIVVHDASTEESWGHINFDDLRVGSHATNNGKGLTFNVLGQANQPPPDGQAPCDLYAKDPLRPQYHYTPYQGWINDPAGLIQWKGSHHLFSQYYPDAPLWGPMHWAHAESSDAVHWRELPVALYPKQTDKADDESGRFTGSAFIDGDSLHLILTDYTDPNAHPDVVQESVIIANSTDGVSFELYEGNPVIPRPPAGAPAFFRDPKIFHDPADDSWKMVIGATNEVDGQVQLYSTTDKFSWSHVGIMHTGNGTTGPLWECPNFFPLGEKWILFYGGNSVGWYEVGSFDGSRFTSEKRGLLDAGPASYAMQWYKDESGRSLAITWMGNWPTPKWPSRVNGWAGQQSITRELFLREDGGLGSRPIAELESLASGPLQELGPKEIQEKPHPLGDTNSARLRLTIDLGATSASSFTLALFQPEAESTLLTYNPESRILTLDTTNAGYGQAGRWEAVIAESNDDKLSLDVFIDRSVLEIYVQDGSVMSASIWPRYQESTNISIVGEGGTVVLESASLTPLGSSWC